MRSPIHEVEDAIWQTALKAHYGDARAASRLKSFLYSQWVVGRLPSERELLACLRDDALSEIPSECLSRGIPTREHGAMVHKLQTLLLGKPAGRQAIVILSDAFANAFGEFELAFFDRLVLQTCKFDRIRRSNPANTRPHDRRVYVNQVTSASCGDCARTKIGGDLFEPGDMKRPADLQMKMLNPDQVGGALFRDWSRARHPRVWKVVEAGTVGVVSIELQIAILFLLNRFVKSGEFFNWPQRFPGILDGQTPESAGKAGAEDTIILGRRCVASIFPGNLRNYTADRWMPIKQFFQRKLVLRTVSAWKKSRHPRETPFDPGRPPAPATAQNDDGAALHAKLDWLEQVLESACRHFSRLPHNGNRVTIMTEMLAVVRDRAESLDLGHDNALVDLEDDWAWELVRRRLGKTKAWRDTTRHRFFEHFLSVPRQDNAELDYLRGKAWLWELRAFARDVRNATRLMRSASSRALLEAMATAATERLSRTRIKCEPHARRRAMRPAEQLLKLLANFPAHGRRLADLEPEPEPEPDLESIMTNPLIDTSLDPEAYRMLESEMLELKPRLSRLRRVLQIHSQFQSRTSGGTATRQPTPPI